MQKRMGWKSVVVGGGGAVEHMNDLTGVLF